MKTYDSLSSLNPDTRGSVLAIGNFDGVHKGHQALLGQARKLAQGSGVPLAVLTFEPHPRRLFRPDEPPGRITPAPVKAHRLEQCGVDALISLPFDWDFASQSAEDFIRRVLSEGIGPSRVVVGSDFRFGQLRHGTPEMIESAGIPVTLFSQVNDPRGEKYSSSTIRQKLREGNIEAANTLLGWEWEIEGTVVRGDRRGHELGFPTANLLLGETLHPSYGVYASRVLIEGETQWRPAATNIGIRPMFEIPTGQVEVHILDFEDRDIYGRVLRLRPVRRLRSEARFASLDALIAQIRQDCAQTREVLKA